MLFVVYNTSLICDTRRTTNRHPLSLVRGEVLILRPTLRSTVYTTTNDTAMLSLTRVHPAHYRRRMDHLSARNYRPQLPLWLVRGELLELYVQAITQTADGDSSCLAY
jgi:hypothetical protein